MDAGLDVMVEKPIAHTLEAARALVDARRDATGASCRWVIWSALIPP